MKRLIALLGVVTIMLTFINVNVWADFEEEEFDLEDYVLVREETIISFDEECIKKTYEKIIDTSMFSRINGTIPSSIIQKRYVEISPTDASGTTTVNGSTFPSISYSLTFNFSYQYSGGLKYCKPVSASSSVVLGGYGMTVSEQKLTLYNTGWTLASEMEDAIYYAPEYSFYGVNTSVTAPSYFEYAFKGDLYPGNLVAFDLKVNKGMMLYVTTDSISCD